MVIEYIGELIRNEVANKREKLYEQQNRGIYMFRLDEEYVVDATMSGCLARYINHSCEVKNNRNSLIYLIVFRNSQIQ
jgi:SET domain-containing protein